MRLEIYMSQRLAVLNCRSAQRGATAMHIEVYVQHGIACLPLLAPRRLGVNCRLLPQGSLRPVCKCGCEPEVLD